jgi:hypothetical protein
MADAAWSGHRRSLLGVDSQQTTARSAVLIAAELTANFPADLPAVHAPAEA